ncbi:unnamed protein product [Camellia sinensis]
MFGSQLGLFHFPFVVFCLLVEFIRAYTNQIVSLLSFSLPLFVFGTNQTIEISMAMFTLTSACTNNNISQALSLNNDNRFRDASFSSYLNCCDETCMRKLAESSQNLNSIITATPHEHLHLRRKVEDGEIGVFGAEKYFNGGMDEESPRIASNGAINYRHVKKDEPVDKQRIQLETPSTHSDSSWNSQSGLLQSVVRNPPKKKASKRQAKSLLASLGCNCACNDKSSIDIDDHVVESNTKRSGKAVDLARANKSWLNPSVKEEMPCTKIDDAGIGLSREDCFSFPILNSKPVKVHLQEEEDDDKERKSLEVFGSPVLQKKKKAFSLERRLTMLTTWDTNARMEELEIPASCDGTHNDDIESDASSDLFEIESFTNNSNPFLDRQASDGMSSSFVIPTTCYAPSEASIEWSVVTASAADFSVVSDCEDPISSAAAPKKARKMVPNAKAGVDGEREKRLTGILLGCKSQKAVRIARDAYITNGKAVPDPRRCHRTDSFAPVTRFQALN